MRLLLVTAGSRGDVEPFVALGRRAVARGHEVLLVGPRGTAALASEATGVEVRELDVDYRRMIEEQGGSPVRAMRAFRRVVRPAMRAVIVDSARIALEHAPDAIVHHPKVLSAPLAAARVGAASVLAELVPSVTPTSAFPAAGTLPAGPAALNRASYRLTAAAGAMFRGEMREASALLGDPVAPPRTGATLVPVSPTLLQRPADWPPSVHLTGAWAELGGSAPLDPELERFLEGGDVLSVGFGSMASGDPLRRGAAFVEAARALGLRTLVMRGWGGADVPAHLLGADVLAVDAAPHEHVLPQVLVAAHHGGAGTAHATVRAGAPSVVMPFLADQPFWAAALHRRGLAAAPVRRGADARRLDAAIEDALRCRDRAAEAARRMAREDGTGAAVDVLEALSR
ncbi:glycosyltransferase [Agrococcus sp. BE272]|uniref:glycosyltransferase n=1 Tax=Agrococcus sp. BE272 TaxID=2817727 RepID=UPI00285C709B|nr:glycosyltransferase [Agrococcus sp. BE272]MDR7234081.1 sterol 3beta-glucosyltransferase [Agrococcus sp. BE272]